MTYQGKKVLVTGAGGFIGSHLAEALVRAGANTRALVHYNAMGSRGWLDHSPLKDEIEVIAGDIRDRDCVMSAVSRTNYVFHLAALIAIPYSYQAPLSYMHTNIEGTLNILQAARELCVECLVHTSTSEVYGTARSVPISEHHPLQGQSPYAASKIGADKMAEAFNLSFDLPVIIVRPFNTFGPRQSARAVIPAIITQCLAGSALKLGNLRPTRDLTFVEDTVMGFLCAANSPAAIGRQVNIGSGKEISIGELARLIMTLTGTTAEIEKADTRIRPERSEVERLLADNKLAKDLLDWQPSVSLEEGLRRTINWMKENIGKYRPDAYAV